MLSVKCRIKGFIGNRSRISFSIFNLGLDFLGSVTEGNSGIPSSPGLNTEKRNLSIISSKRVLRHCRHSQMKSDTTRKCSQFGKWTTKELQNNWNAGEFSSILPRRVSPRCDLDPTWIYCCQDRSSHSLLESSECQFGCWCNTPANTMLHLRMSESFSCISICILYFVFSPAQWSLPASCNLKESNECVELGK